MQAFAQSRKSVSILTFSLVAMTACSSGESTTDPGPVTPTPKPVATVTLDRTTVSIEQGKTTTLVATARDADGNVLTDRAISWSSNANAVATVSSAGLITALTTGNAQIKATSEGKSATANITVTPIPIASIVLNSDSVELAIGANATFTAEPRSEANLPLTGRNITWAAQDVTVVSIANGVVTALAPGNTTITATSEGITATAKVVVKAPTCESTVATGRLAGPDAQNLYTYTTLAGWRVRFDRSQLKIHPPDYDKTYEFWGSMHENLAGLHVKDILQDRRTLLLPGDVIVTINTNVPPGATNANGMELVQSISIYEGNESHRVDMQTHAVVASCALPMFGEAEEHDGEAARLYFNATGLQFDNVYEQYLGVNGIPTPKVFNTVRLAETFFANPNQVNDYFDDPRLIHTFW